MVSLVLVSHVQAIALGTKMLAEQMATDTIRIEAAGGIAADTTADTEGVLSHMPADEPMQVGTDAVRIADAVKRCWSSDGVLLLVDLGSAVLSAELALDLLPEEMSKRCLISNAPLVEGAVIAALEASLGHSLEAVNEAAEGIVQIPKVMRSS